MKRKSFTLLELTIILVIVGILVTLGFPLYNKLMEDSKARVCETNLKALATALEVYAMDNDRVPSTLSQLPQEYIQKAYASILKQSKDAWKIKLAYFILDLKEKGLAHAAFLKDDLAKGDISLITCPKDPTPPGQGGTSYGINSLLAGVNYQYYLLNFADSTFLIADCDNATFSQPRDFAERHNYHRLWGGNYAQTITKDKRVVLKNLLQECAEYCRNQCSGPPAPGCYAHCMYDCAGGITPPYPPPGE